MAVYGVSVDELADYLRIEDEREHVHLSDALDSAKEAVDSFCGWDFDLGAEADDDTTRVFAARWADLIYIDPVVAITSLSVDTSGDGTFNQTWSTSDYQLEPLNGRQAGLSDHPYYKIRAIESKRFPVSARATVQIVGDFGWATVPGSVKKALKMHAGRLHQRRNTPAALIGSEDGGVVARTSMGLDSDVKQLLHPFSQHSLWAA